MAPATGLSSLGGTQDPLGGLLGQGVGSNSPASQGGNSIGDSGVNSAGKLGGISGGNSNPTTTSKGTDPSSQSQPLLPAASTTQPTSAALGSPVTPSDAARSASQSAEAARHTNAPSSGDSSDDKKLFDDKKSMDDKMHTSSVNKIQTQSAIGPSSTPYSSASPVSSTSAPSATSHLVGPIMGVIFVLGVMSLAGRLLLQYHRRRQKAARKLRENQNAILFIEQLSQYDKPSSGEKI